MTKASLKKANAQSLLQKLGDYANKFKVTHYTIANEGLLSFSEE
jgi:hypothetical protein